MAETLDLPKQPQDKAQPSEPPPPDAFHLDSGFGPPPPVESEGGSRKNSRTGLGAQKPSDGQSDEEAQKSLDEGLAKDPFRTGDPKKLESIKADTRDAGPTVQQDLKTLRDPNAKNSEVEEAGERLVDRASSLVSDSGDGIISSLRSISESDKSSRREKREAEGLLLDTFDKLSLGGKGLSSETAQERIIKMGKIALGPLGEISKNSPEHRDKADFLTGVIEADKQLRDLWQAYGRSQPDKAEPLISSMSDTVADLKSTKGAGLAREINREIQEWRPDGGLREGLERSLSNAADRLLRDPQALNREDVRERLQAIGPQAAGALQKIVDGNPQKNDNLNPDGKQQREQAQKVINDIAKDLATKDLTDAWRAINTSDKVNTSERLKDPAVRLAERAGDVNNPLAEQTLKELRHSKNEWRPGTEDSQFASQTLKNAVDKILSKDNALANPAAHSLLRAAGSDAIPALQKIAGEGGPKARVAERIIQQIKDDDPALRGAG